MAFKPNKDFEVLKMVLKRLGIPFLIENISIVTAAILIEGGISTIFLKNVSPIIEFGLGIIFLLAIFFFEFRKSIGGFAGFVFFNVFKFVAGLLVWGSLNDLFFRELNPVIKVLAGIVVLFVIFFFVLRGKAK